MTNRKSHMGFPLTPRSMTLNDLELRSHFGGISRTWDPTAAKRMKIDPQYQRRNCSPLKVLFSGI